MRGTFLVTLTLLNAQDTVKLKKSVGSPDGGYMSPWLVLREVRMKKRSFDEVSGSCGSSSLHAQPNPTAGGPEATAVFAASTGRSRFDATTGDWSRRLLVGLIGLSLTMACGSEASLSTVDVSTEDGDTGDSPPGETPDAAATESDDLSTALGDGDGDVSLVQLFVAPEEMFCVSGVCTTGIPTDLEFNPKRPEELWVVFRQPNPPGLCEQEGDQSGCPYLHGKVAIITNTASDSPTVEVKEDGNSWHFMRLTTTMAFADDDTFATIGEDRTGNPHDSAVDYMGPTLWSSDPSIFAVDFQRNGSHLDMLHASPYGMGIAHQKDHVFFVFNGNAGSIDAYDFKAPHEPGGEDHSDGTLMRYIEGEVSRLPNVPSHMDFLPDQTTLLIADSGNGRVIALDTASGRVAERLSTPDGQIADPRRIADATFEEIVPAGRLEQPSGLVVGASSFAVGDAATGKIHQFTFDGKPQLTLDLELPAGALGGLELGPDGRLYLTRKDTNEVVRVDAK